MSQGVNKFLYVNSVLTFATPCTVHLNAILRIATTLIGSWCVIQYKGIGIFYFLWNFINICCICDY